MNLPEVIQSLINAQNKHDNAAYANCFSEAAVVTDEGETYSGRTEIKRWIEEANKKYHTAMKPVDFKQSGSMGVLKAQVSGTFDGSPVVLNYHFELPQGLIQSLRISG